MSAGVCSNGSCAGPTSLNGACTSSSDCINNQSCSIPSGYSLGSCSGGFAPSPAPYCSSTAPIHECPFGVSTDFQAYYCPAGTNTCQPCQQAGGSITINPTQCNFPATCAAPYVKDNNGNCVCPSGTFFSNELQTCACSGQGLVLDPASNSERPCFLSCLSKGCLLTVSLRRQVA